LNLKSIVDVVHDCTDIFGDSGVYTIGATSYQVYCDMNTDEGHWLVREVIYRCLIVTLDFILV